jgi:periplasmic divalent cation tolerance protein
MSELLWVYITAGEMEEAQRIGRTLVEKRLAACANLVEKMHSIYWWENEIHEDDEVILIAKTKATLLPHLVQEVKALHSYDCPCVVALPVLGGNADYLEWIRNEAG